MLRKILEENPIESSQVSVIYAITFLFFFFLIVFGNFPAFSHDRWYSGLDINRDGSYTIGDFVKWALWIFNMPGDVLIQGVMMSKSTSRFFEVTINSYSSVGSMMFSFLYWGLAGGKTLMKYWLAILALIMLNNLPKIPLLY